MSAHGTTGAQRIAERLAYAARRFAELDGIREEQSVEIQWRAPLSQEGIEIHVHGCEPDELLTHRAYFVGCEAHEDADGILRWIEIDLDGIAVTFYRR